MTVASLQLSIENKQWEDLIRLSDVPFIYRMEIYADK